MGINPIPLFEQCHLVCFSAAGDRFLLKAERIADVANRCMRSLNHLMSQPCTSQSSSVCTFCGSGKLNCTVA